jgi:uncharacterized protein (DUF4213/DUF364 family)
VDMNASKIILEKGMGKNVAIIGSFPFVPSVKEVARHLSVLERVPQPDTLPEIETQTVIPCADVVAITGSAVINHSIDWLLSLCHPDAYVIVLGPSTPLTPILFEHGVDALSGTLVTDIPLALQSISEGAIFRQVLGVRRVSMIRDRAAANRRF